MNELITPETAPQIVSGYATFGADRNPALFEPKNSSAYCVTLASGIEDLREAQRLRYDVFSSEYGVCFRASGPKLDEDEFDAYCKHIIAREQSSQQVVGTYRVLLPEQAKLLGRYYSEGEFYMTRIRRQLGRLAELGRSCVHVEHRTGAVILLLWSAIIRLMRQHHCSHAIGCASVSMRDGGTRAATLWNHFQDGFLVDPLLESFPKNKLPLGVLALEKQVLVPPLVRGYLKVGARVCGEPNWDPDFNTADFLMLLDLSGMNPRYARHFGI